MDTAPAGEFPAEEDPPLHNTEDSHCPPVQDTDDCHSNTSGSEEDIPVHSTKDCSTEHIDSALETRKAEFYSEVDNKLAAISPDQRAKHIMSDDQFNNIMNFLLIYLITFVMGSLVISLMGYDFATSLGAVATCLGNVGPAIGEVGPVDNFAFFSSPAKIVLSFLMLLGRLELFTLLILFTPFFWRAN